MVFGKHVLILMCAVTVFLSQQAQSRSAVANALRKAERSLCKAVDATGCSRKKKTPRAAKPETRKKTKLRAPEPTSPIVPDLPVVTIEKTKPPLPRPKPLDLQEIPPEPTIDVAPLVPAKPITPKNTPSPIAPALPKADAAACYAALTKLGVTFTANAPYEQNGSCKVVNPVQLKSYKVNNANIGFPDHPILNCAFSLQFLNFIRDNANPAIAAKTSSQLAKLYTGPGFVCRGRNGDTSAKLSEHASGNAVDIERIQLADGRIVLVKDAISTSTKDYDVLTTMRHAACAYFTTVIGPGANEAHASHFHFDLGQHGKSGTYRICE
jgi:hypothetical protein